MDPPNRFLKRYIKGICKTSNICPAFLDEIKNSVQERIKKFIKPKIISKLLEEMFTITFEPINADRQFRALTPTNSSGYEIMQTHNDDNDNDKELHFFLTKDIPVENCFTIAIVAGGGTGGHSDHSGGELVTGDNDAYTNGTGPSNGGGAGGGILQVYNISGKKGDMVTLLIGNGGKIATDPYGEHGKNSYIKYYNFDSSGTSTTIPKWWICVASGGSAGDIESRGTENPPLFYQTMPPYYDGRGGNGGDETVGDNADLVNPVSNFFFQNPWPTSLIDSCSGGGGGAASQNGVDYSGGCPGGCSIDDFFDKYVFNNNGYGGHRGPKFENLAEPPGDLQMAGVGNLEARAAGIYIYGSGGGAGGVYHDGENTYNYPGGDGAPGLGMIFRKMASGESSAFSSTFTGETTNYTYVIFPSSVTPYSINFNVTATISFILIGGGGSGGRSKDKEENGGGGGGGVVYGKLNLTNSDTLAVKVGGGGIFNKSTKASIKGEDSSLHVNNDTLNTLYAYGGTQGIDSAKGVGGSFTILTSSKITSAIGLKGGDGGRGAQNGYTGPLITSSHIPSELLNKTQLIQTRYSGGGAGGLGGHNEDLDYSGGNSGNINGTGGLAIGHGAPTDGIISGGIGGGGGAGGFKTSNAREYDGANGNSGIFIAWYAKI